MRSSVKTIVAGVAVTLSLAGLAACGSDSDSAAKPKASASASASATPAAEKADLTGIPAVVATVNDDKITKDDFVTAYENQFSQAQTTAQTSGTPVDQDALKKTTVDGLVSNRLLLAEADKRKFTASDAEVTKALDGYATQAGATDTAAYLKTLADQGLDEAEVRKEVSSQLKLDELLADEAGDKKPTKAELQAIYDQAVAAQAASATGEESASTIPPFDQVQDELKEEAKSQKENAAAEKLLTKLKKTATIKINL